MNGCQGISFLFIYPNWQFPGDRCPGRKELFQRDSDLQVRFSSALLMLLRQIVLSPSSSCVVCERVQPAWFILGHRGRGAVFG